jgi:dTDP-4-keto-6-deoxyhexose 4-ketoreductase
MENRPEERLQAPDTIFHLAGQTSAYGARANLETDIRANILGFAQVVLASLESGASPYVVVAGAATEVGLQEHLWVSDRDEANPQTFYDIAKVVQGTYLQQFTNEGWVNGCRVKFANVYGGLSTGASDRAFLNRSVQAAMAGNPLTYYSDAKYIRDYLYVSDAASALVAAATSQELTRDESFLVGTGRGIPIYDVLAAVSDAVHAVTGVRAPVVPIEPPEGLYAIDRRDVAVDAGRFRSLTGWAPKFTLEMGIRALIQDLTVSGR